MRWLLAGLAAGALLIGVSAWGQTHDGEIDILAVAGSADIGKALVTDASPPSGYTAWREYWVFDSGAWPDEDFELSYDAGTFGSGVTADFEYNHGPFPQVPTGQLPTSLGQDDLLYRVRLCGESCVEQGYLWVEDSGEEVHWYGNGNIPSSGYITPSSGQVVRFEVLGDVPPGTGYFRLYESDRL